MTPVVSRAVVLPGMDGTGALLVEFAAALGEQFQVEVIDYPRDRPLDHAGLREWVRERLPGPDYLLVAESFSGPIALALAAEHPPGMRALVLCASFGQIDLPFKRALASIAALMPVRAVPMRLLSHVLWGRWHSRLHQKQLADVLSSVDPVVLQCRLRQTLSAQACPVQTLPMPLLYLQAEADRVVAAGAAAGLASTQPHMQVRRFDAPHFLLQVRPRECAQAIAAFAAALPHSGS